MADSDSFLLPSEVVEESVGFSLDIGGSAAKLVYRAKEDYENGKPKPGTTQDGMGIVRVTIFSNNQADELLNFMCDHCDVTSHQNGGVVYTTGINSFTVLDKVRQRFGDDIKFESLTEFICVIKAFLYLFKHCPKERLWYPTDEIAMREGMTKANQLRKFQKDAKSNMGDVKGVGGKKSEEGQAEGPVAEPMGPELPCVMAMLGSGSGYFIVDEEGTFTAKDGAALSGKVFTSVANIICGKCMKFDDLMELAAKGDITNVDVFGRDFSIRGNGIDDIYTSIGDDFTVFPFGKPSQEPPKNFATCDLVAGWLNVAAENFVQCAQTVALSNKVDRICIAGNFARPLISRQCMTRAWFYRKDVFSECREVQMDFLKNGGHLGSLGAFMNKMKTEETKISFAN